MIGDVLREAADTLETGSTFRCYHTKGGDSVAELDILSPEFTREAEAAWDRARNQALARGVPVFYRNDRTGFEIMEQPRDLEAVVKVPNWWQRMTAALKRK